MFLEDLAKGKRYHINAELGKGSYGKCYLATELDTGVKVACKQMKDIDEFKSEAGIHSKLRHRHIVNFLSSFVVCEMGYITMELCTKGNMDHLLRRRGVLTNPEVKCIMKQVVNGLNYLHKSLIVHRDIKLLNLLLSENMELKIADFGLARQLRSTEDKRESFCGTNNYVAPEIIDGIGYSFAADIWALGCVFYTLLVGKEPFWGLTTEATLRNISRISFAKSKLSLSAYIFLKSVFVKNPEERPTASTILNHVYFSKGPTLDALPHTLFDGPPKVREQREPKISTRRPLADRTNLRSLKDRNNFGMVLRSQKLASETQKGYKHAAVETENATPVAPQMMTLDYPNKITHKNKKSNSAAKNETNEGTSLRLDTSNTLNDSNDSWRYEFVTHATERQLLTLAENLLQLDDVEYSLELRSLKSSFLCVTRWAETDSGMLAYTLNDGSWGINMGSEKDHFYRYPGGKIKYIQNDTNYSFVKDCIPTGLERLVAWADEIRRLLLNLKKSGPIVYFKDPVFVTAWKYFKNSPITQSTAMVFLLANGTCQVNMPNHEKFMLNIKDDSIATWVGKEVTIFSLKKLIDNGLPHGLREKLMFVPRLLREVIPRNLQ